MKFATAVATSLMLMPSTFAALVPRRNTPNFYLVSVPGLQAVGISGNTLRLGSGTPVKVYLDGPNQLAVDNGPSPVYINFGGTGTTCSTSGPLQLGSSGSNKCAQSSGFFISSYDQNSQLGAKLVFNWAGGFHNCGGAVTYSSSGTPSGCSPVTLWTVPATQ